MTIAPDVNSSRVFSSETRYLFPQEGSELVDIFRLFVLTVAIIFRSDLKLST